MAKKTSLPWSIALSLRIYQWLLNIGPNEFCHDYGTSMVQVFRQCCLDAHQQRGMFGVILLWLPMFGDAMIGIGAERLATIGNFYQTYKGTLSGSSLLPEGMISMVRTRRRSMLLIFFAFVLFGLAWLFFFRLNDPLSEWEPIARLHPEVVTTYRVIVSAGETAFLMMLALGIPVVLSTIKGAFLTKRRATLILVGIAVFASVVFTIATVLVLAGVWNGGPGGGLFGLLFLVVLLTVIITLALAVTRSEPSTRVLRFALVPATLVTMAMAVALVATLLEAVFLSSALPRGFSGSDTVNWVIADVMMLVATACATFALWRSFRTRSLTIA